MSEEEKKRDYRKNSPWDNAFLYPDRKAKKKAGESESGNPQEGGRYSKWGPGTNPVKGIRIRLPEDESIYTKTTYIDTPYVDREGPPSPRRCKDPATLLIHMCRTAREQGWTKCEDCETPCAWGREYVRRMRGGAGTRPRPKRDPSATWNGTGQIPYFGPWLKEELRRRGLTQKWLSIVTGMALDTINIACSGERWSRRLELKAMEALNMDEQTVTQRAAAWAWQEREKT